MLTINKKEIRNLSNTIMITHNLIQHTILTCHSKISLKSTKLISELKKLRPKSKSNLIQSLIRIFVLEILLITR